MKFDPVSSALPISVIEAEGKDESRLRARDAVREALGADALRRLHRSSLLIDISSLLVCCSLFIALAIYLGAAGNSGIVPAVAFVSQGFLILILAYLNHDICVHRQVFAEPLRSVISRILTLPIQLAPTIYQRAHLAHHQYLGTARDPEMYKMDINTRGKRWFFATVLGVQLCFMGKFAVDGGRRYPNIVRNADAKVSAKFRRDRLCNQIWWLSLGLLALIYPRVVIIGYILPMVVVSPIANSLRVLLEHMDLDRDNPFCIATFYKTNWLSRIAFLWDAGDCHTVHHLYPRIPFYRMGEALELMRPVLLRNGVVEHTSLISLLIQWFVKNKPHWTAPTKHD